MNLYWAWIGEKEMCKLDNCSEDVCLFFSLIARENPEGLFVAFFEVAAPVDKKSGECYQAFSQNTVYNAKKQCKASCFALQSLPPPCQPWRTLIVGQRNIVPNMYDVHKFVL